MTEPLDRNRETVTGLNQDQMVFTSNRDTVCDCPLQIETLRDCPLQIEILRDCPLQIETLCDCPLKIETLCDCPLQIETLRDGTDSTEQKCYVVQWARTRFDSWNVTSN